MKKILTGLMVSAALMLGVTTVNADEPTVTFDGTTELKYNTDAQNFGSAFNGMLPSETREQSIVLSNDSDETVQFFMSTQTLRALESDEALGAMYSVSLDVTNGDTKTVIYGTEDGQTTEVGGANSQGLRDINGTLNNKIMVATLAPNEKATVRLTVGLDGTSTVNAYQSRQAIFQFDFSAQYDDSEPLVPETINRTEERPGQVITVPNAVQKVIDKVKTGDPYAISGLCAVMVTAAVGIILLRRKGGDANEK